VCAPTCENHARTPVDACVREWRLLLEGELGPENAAGVWVWLGPVPAVPPHCSKVQVLCGGWPYLEEPLEDEEGKNDDRAVSEGRFCGMDTVWWMGVAAIDAGNNDVASHLCTARSFESTTKPMD
jgi:hypothetical protein